MPSTTSAASSTGYAALAVDIAQAINRSVATAHFLSRPHGGPRLWHSREQGRYPLHPLVMEVLTQHRAHDMHQLVLEWPHVSIDDAAQVAYTRDDAKGAADIQTRAGLGKYLRRHFPDLADHTLRDYTALYAASAVSECRFVDNDVAQYVRVVQTGPQSCMKWADSDAPHRLDDGETIDDWHPYRVYAPSLGWRMAVRVLGGATVARALVLESGHCKQFVRSFRACGDDPHSTGYSNADEALEAWLTNAGYTKASSWDGAVIAKIESHRTQSSYDYLLPYLDGDCQRVTYVTEGFRVSHTGEYECDSIDGGYSIDDDDDDDSTRCDDCGDTMHIDDTTYVEYTNHTVCPSCLRSNYTRVSSTDKYVPDADVVTAVDGYTWAGDDVPDGYTLVDGGLYMDWYAPDEDTVTDRHLSVWHIRDVRSGELVVLCDESREAGEYAERCDCTEHEGYGWMLDDEDAPDETAEVTEQLIIGE